jgi:hypothetical protein
MPSPNPKSYFLLFTHLLLDNSRPSWYNIVENQIIGFFGAILGSRKERRYEIHPQGRLFTDCGDFLRIFYIRGDGLCGDLFWGYGYGWGWVDKPKNDGICLTYTILSDTINIDN